MGSALLSFATLVCPMHTRKRNSSPVTAGGKNGGGLGNATTFQLFRQHPGGKSSGREGLTRRQYAGIDRRFAPPLHTRNGDFHGSASRLMREVEAFEMAFKGQHGGVRRCW